MVIIERSGKLNLAPKQLDWTYSGSASGNGIPKIRATEGSVFFLDLRSFSILTSRLQTAKRENAFVNLTETRYSARLRYILTVVGNLYALANDIVACHVARGVIDNYLIHPTGDGVMVALEGEQHAETATRAAVELALRFRRVLVDVVNPEISKLGISRSRDRLDFGIGVSSGEFSEIAFDRDLPGFSNTVVGTTVNIAARVEEACKDHDETVIAIAEPTVRIMCENIGIDPDNHRLIEDSFGVRYLWRHALKGVGTIGLYTRLLDDDPFQHPGGGAPLSFEPGLALEPEAEF